MRLQKDIWDMSFSGGVKEALDILNKERIDAVITDISMPGKDGVDLLHSIRKGNRTIDIPVVILTCLNDQKLKRKALELGATDLLNKPAGPDELIAHIAKSARNPCVMMHLCDNPCTL